MTLPLGFRNPTAPPRSVEPPPPGSIRSQALGVNGELRFVLTVDKPMSEHQADRLLEQFEQLCVRDVVVLEKNVSLGYIGCTRCAALPDVDGRHASSLDRQGWMA